MLLDANVVTAPPQSRTELIMGFPLVVKFNFMFADNLQGKFVLINKAMHMFLFILFQKKRPVGNYP